MKILSIGGGPAGLYLALLARRRDPRAEVTVLERNRAGETFGFGVVFSDATMDSLRLADPESHAQITASFAHWDDIAIHARGETVVSTGHGFAGLGRRRLLEVLERRCAEVGVDVRHGVEAPVDPAAWAGFDLVLGADGANSAVRARLADVFRPEVDLRPNRFTWLGTTFPFDAFTFYFKETPEGLWRVHAYRYAPGESTFIVEATEATWRAAGLDRADEAQTIAHLERTFATELAGHRLIGNRSIWRQFPVVSCATWATDKVVLLGDAAHTAHFSIGSGTKLALEDAIALDVALAGAGSVRDALESYQRARRPVVDSTQRAAQASLEWFEHTERYAKLEPLQFAMSLLTRSLRVTHANLRLRDPGLVEQTEQWFAEGATRQVAGGATRQGGDRALRLRAEDGPPLGASGGGGVTGPVEPLHPSPAESGPVPPMLTPFRLRELVLPNRVVVSPMCQYSAKEGVVGDWHLVHLGSRALGGAGLVMCEMTCVSPDARITHGCAGIWNDVQADAWRRIVAFAHDHARTAIGLQLGHAGRKGATCLPWEGGDDCALSVGDWPLVAPSPLPWTPENQPPRAMTRADMERVTAEFAAAARRADAVGFDLLEVHAAHGYLLASFLSPLTNQRDDAYGGDVAGRARFPFEVIAAVRAAWPSHKPLSVRLSATDWAPGGLSEDDLLAIARGLGERGVDLIDVSAGQTVPDQRPRYGRLFQTPFADLVRLETGLATMAVGAIATWEDASSVLIAGRADLVAIARGHLWDPYFTRHAAHAQGAPLPWPAPYEALTRFNPNPGRRG